MRWRLKPHVAIVPLDAENVLVRGAGVFLRYSGEAVPVLLRLAPLLDGTRDDAQLARESGIETGDVRDVLEGLRADRLLDDAAADEPLARPAAPERLRAWSLLTHQPQRAENHLAAARILLVGQGEVASHAEAALLAMGVARVEREGEGHAHVIVASDEPDAEGFAAANARALAEGITATYVHLDGVEAIVGPTVVPRESACWRCYELRALGAHPNPERLLAARALSRPPAVRLAPFAAIAGGWAAQAAAVAVSGAGAPPLAGHVAQVDLLALRSRRHRVLRIPRCPACSPGAVPDIDRYALEPLGP